MNELIFYCAGSNKALIYTAAFLTEEEVQKLREDSEKALLNLSIPLKKIIYPTK